jgi:hypothetical protein
MAYVTKPKRGPTPGFQRSRIKKESTPLGVTGKQGRQAIREAKRTSAMGVTPKDVKQAKSTSNRPRTESQRRKLREKTGKVRPYTPKVPTIKTRLTNLITSLTFPKGGVGKAKEIARNVETRSDATKAEELINKLASSKSKGGTVSRKGGGKIMQGYKAGGKV